jgi:Uma2 family endonuclease
METTPINFMRSMVSGKIFAGLQPHVEAHGLGRVLPCGLYYVLWKAGLGVNMARVPDVSFIRAERLNVFDPMLPYPGAPDFAVECVTVTEADMVTLDKVRDYLTAGTQEVWMVYVGLGEIHQYRRDEPRLVRVYFGDDVIASDTLFSGLRLRVADLFPKP